MLVFKPMVLLKTLSRRQILLLAGAPTLGFMLLFSVACSSPSYSQTTNEKKDKPGTPIETEKVTTGAISASYQGTASLESEAEAVVVARIGGIVDQILVEEAQMVKKDQPLAKLEEEQYKLEMNQAEALLNKLRNEFQRKESLYKNKVISSDAYEQSKYELESQKSNTELARLRWRFTTIRAPFSGVVGERLIKAGNMIQANQPAFRVTSLDFLQAILHIPEREINKLKKNQPALIRADALPDMEFTGYVLRISPVVSPGAGVFKVTVAVKDPSGQLKPGMFTRVEILRDTHENALLLPKNTILQEDSQSWVFLVKGKKAVKVKVDTGYKNKSHVEILSGLKAGDQVAATGLAALKDGADIQVL